MAEEIDVLGLDRLASKVDRLHPVKQLAEHRHVFKLAVALPAASKVEAQGRQAGLVEGMGHHRQDLAFIVAQVTLEAVHQDRHPVVFQSRRSLQQAVELQAVAFNRNFHDKFTSSPIILNRPGNHHRLATQ